MEPKQEPSSLQLDRRDFAKFGGLLALYAATNAGLGTTAARAETVKGSEQVNEEDHVDMDKSTLDNAYGMPLIRPGFAPTGTRFVDRETMKIFYRTDRDALKRWVPEPLKITDPVVSFEVVSMHDASGCGVFHESGQMIEVELDGVRGNLVHMLFLDSMAAVLAGREIFGFPKKLGCPKLFPDGDALVGTLDVGQLRVATATMGYKYYEDDLDTVRKETEDAKTFLIKLLPGVDARPKVFDLVQCSTVDVVMKGAWHGPGALHLVPHALAPLTALPVVEVLKATHTVMDMSYGNAAVKHDFLS